MMEHQESEEVLQKESDKEMMNMFASVWVKVEVETPDSDTESKLNTMPLEQYVDIESKLNNTPLRQDSEKKSKLNTLQQNTDIESTLNITPLQQYADKIVKTIKSINKQEKKKKKKKNPKTFTCDLCDYTTIYKNCLELHILGHENAKPFVCTMCGYSTKYPNSLQRHMVIKHQAEEDNKEPKTYKCEYCKYTTPYKWNLSAHSRKHKQEKQFKCPQCSYATAYRHNYIKHSRKHMEHMVFKCDKCPFQTKFEGHITRHLSKIHNEVIDSAHKCDLCDFATLVKWRLNVHKQRSRQEEAIKCSHCFYESFFNCEMKKHKQTHFSQIYGPPKCVNSRLTYRSNDDYVHSEDVQSSQLEGNLPQAEYGVPPHFLESFNQNNLSDSVTPLPENVQTVSDTLGQQKVQDNFALPNISVKPTDLSELATIQNNTVTNDEENVDNDPETKTGKYRLDPDCVDWHSIQVLESDDKERPFLCLMCSYTSRFKASVQRHFQRHHTGNHSRPYKCCNCDFSTKTKDQIALHNKRSKSDVLVFCIECQFATFYKCKLVLHQKSHYAFKCTKCEYTCRHKHELQKHFSAIHLGNGVKCRFCDYKSARKESVLCHETVHTGIKPFKCDYCEYSSVRRSLLDNHLKRYHSEIKTDITIVDESKIDSLRTALTNEQLEFRTYINNQLAHCENSTSKTTKDT